MDMRELIKILLFSSGLGVVFVIVVTLSMKYVDPFWAAVGTTQSGGSRYESGREMPSAVSELVRLVHINQIELHRINKTHLDVVALLKAKHPEIYNTLKKSAKLLKGSSL